MMELSYHVNSGYQTEMCEEEGLERSTDTCSSMMYCTYDDVDFTLLQYSLMSREVIASRFNWWRLLIHCRWWISYEYDDNEFLCQKCHMCTQAEHVAHNTTKMYNKTSIKLVIYRFICPVCTCQVCQVHPIPLVASLWDILQHLVNSAFALSKQQYRDTHLDMRGEPANRDLVHETK